MKKIIQIVDEKSSTCMKTKNKNNDVASSD
jgi:hypothetical protein